MTDQNCKDYISEQLAKIIPELERLGKGDLTVGMDKEAEMGTEFAELLGVINMVANRMKEMDNQIKNIGDMDRYRLAGLLEGMTDGVVVFDLEKKIVLTNSMIEELMGEAKENLTLNKMIEFIKQKLVENKGELLPVAEIEKGIWEKLDLWQGIDKALSGGLAVRFSQIPIKKDYYELLIFPVKNYEHKISGGALIIHDITHLMEVDKMKTEFVSVASHQLRTPLTAMRLFLEMLANGDAGELNKLQREYINNVEESTRRMIRLVNDLLNVSRIESGKLAISPELIQLEYLIDDVVKDLQPIAEERNCKLLFSRPAQDFNKVPVDLVLFREVLRNLVANAIYYAKDGEGEARIFLETRGGQDLDNNRIFDNKFGNVDYVIIKVQDNGIGIPEEIKSRIFEKFFRADNAIKKRSEGSGLGLYLVKMIMESSGGNVWFKSPVSEDKKFGGTAFYLALPFFGMMRREGEKSFAF